MIKKIVAFIALVGCMQTALYAQENQNRTLINAALHGWEYEIRAGVNSKSGDSLFKGVPSFTFTDIGYACRLSS